MREQSYFDNLLKKHARMEGTLVAFAVVGEIRRDWEDVGRALAEWRNEEMKRNEQINESINPKPKKRKKYRHTEEWKAEQKVRLKKIWKERKESKLEFPA